MATFALPSILIFIIVYHSAITIKGSIIETSIPSLSKSSFVEVKSNQEDAGGTRSNMLDIHVTMESGGSSSNLKNVIRDEVTSILRNFNNGLNKSFVDNPEEKGPIVARSIKSDFEKNILATKLDHIISEFQNIEKTLKDIQGGDKKSSVNVKLGEICLEEKTSLGVNCNSCHKKKQIEYPKNCKEVQKNGNNVSGLYEIYPTNSKEPFFVLCDMETRGGGWTHVQKRFDGSQDFFLGWRDYKFGFGDLEGEFWLGLQKMYLLAGFEPTELLVEIVDRDNVSAYAHYTSFAIGPEPGGYKLDRLAGFSGDAGDSLTHHLGEKFSTKDLDFTKLDCATQFFGAWWYKACHISNLNGKFINVDLPEKYKFKGLHWQTFRSHEYCHSKSRMLVRPVN